MVVVDIYSPFLVSMTKQKWRLVTLLSEQYHSQHRLFHLLGRIVCLLPFFERRDVKRVGIPDLNGIAGNLFQGFLKIGQLRDERPDFTKELHEVVCLAEVPVKPDERALEVFFDCLLSMEADGIDGNIGGSEIVLDVLQVALRLPKPERDNLAFTVVHRGVSLW